MFVIGYILVKKVVKRRRLAHINGISNEGKFLFKKKKIVCGNSDARRELTS